MPPSTYINGFVTGKKFQINLEVNTTIQEFANKMFNKDHIGLIAVNGKVTFENPVLSEGDLVDIYSLIMGG